MVLMTLYSEPIKGDVYRYVVREDTPKFLKAHSSTYISQIFEIPNKVYPDGSYYHEALGSLWPETDKWLVKYQDSLSHRVSQNSVVVYFVNPIKRWKLNTRSLVITDNGVCFHTLVPTSPAPRLGESFRKLRMDLTVVSLVPVKDLLEKVMEARKADPSLV